MRPLSHAGRLCGNSSASEVSQLQLGKLLPSLDLCGKAGLSPIPVPLASWCWTHWAQLSPGGPMKQHPSPEHGLDWMKSIRPKILG